MRNYWKSLNLPYRIGLVGAVLLTAPISIPLIIYNTIRRKRQPRPTSAVVTDLRAKLWHGFGETTATAIIEHLAQQRYSRHDRAQLAAELARWLATSDTTKNGARRNDLKVIDKLGGAGSKAKHNTAPIKKFDVVLISDFGLLGGTRRCNEGYILAATRAGLRVGLFPYPKWDLPYRSISQTYFEWCRKK